MAMSVCWGRTRGVCYGPDVVDGCGVTRSPLWPINAWRGKVVRCAVDRQAVVLGAGRCRQRRRQRRQEQSRGEGTGCVVQECSTARGGRHSGGSCGLSGALRRAVISGRWWAAWSVQASGSYAAAILGEMLSVECFTGAAVLWVALGGGEGARVLYSVQVWTDSGKTTSPGMSGDARTDETRRACRGNTTRPDGC